MANREADPYNVAAQDFVRRLDDIIEFPDEIPAVSFSDTLTRATSNVARIKKPREFEGATITGYGVRTKTKLGAQLTSVITVYEKDGEIISGHIKFESEINRGSIRTRTESSCDDRSIKGTEALISGVEQALNPISNS